MSEREDTTALNAPTSDLKEMKVEEKEDMPVDRRSSSVATQDSDAPQAAGNGPRKSKSKRKSEPATPASGFQSPAIKPDQEEMIGGEVTIKVEPGKKPRLSRAASQKVVSRPPPLFMDLPDVKVEATSSFDILTDCTYANKYLGVTDAALECDCSEEWDSRTESNHACGEDSDCINRATKMECPGDGDCGCGDACQNQRFQRKQFADVAVIKTDKKGYGLRANKNLKANDFIFEYIGEVISEPAFRRRMHQYDQEGIKHFYFMSLNKGEFVDATKKGNLGRFCNHSCNPNCYVDKWVVGDRLRMGIFAERNIQAGEELVFNYNVDRYGADAQPCYCGEPNCSGYIGGKTQTDSRETQLSNAVQVALGISGASDWDDAVSYKPKRKKKITEDDEEYVDSVELKPVSMSDCVVVMSELYKNTEKWVIVKILDRIERVEDDKTLNKLTQLHGYNTFNRVLKTWIEDNNVVLQVFHILNKIPRLTRNKITDSKIDQTVERLKESENEQIREEAGKLLEAWSKLEMAYRIPRMKRKPNAVPVVKREDRIERRERERSRTRSKSRSRSIDAPRGPAPPSGPRNTAPQRGGANFYSGRPPPFRPRPANAALPPGWFEAVAQNGSTYYYNATGATTWQRPTQPALAAPPPPPPKAVSNQQVLQNLINNIIAKSSEPKQSEKKASAAPTPADMTPKKESKEEKWRSLPIEKQKKIYENTLHPVVSHVMNKYKGKLEKEELKKFAKEIAKKLVESDFRHDRIKNPAKLDEKQQKSVKKFVTDFFERAVAKKKEQTKRNAHKAGQEGASTTPGSPADARSPSPATNNSNDDTAMQVLEDESGRDRETLDTPSESTPGSTGKRKRPEQASNFEADDDGSASKKSKTTTPNQSAPRPPPPPPPPASQAMGSAAEYGQEFENPGFMIKGIASAASKQANSPVQIATPPTTGSPDDGDRDSRKREFAGMNPDRYRSLGVSNGTNGN